MHDADREGLFAALELGPGRPADNLALTALADWFEDQGNPVAADCLHAAARAGWRPGYNRNQNLFGKYFWELEADQPIIGDPAAQLPADLWTALSGYDEQYPVASFKSYPGVRAAYEDLLHAWSRLADQPRPGQAAPSDRRKRSRQGRKQGRAPRSA